ncbi:zf-DHHC-domain-containing protein [Aulographum hederae CBS 113979]|uniref:Palmitoyltransferase n=1 Tax=Aulographum hederae CBS 113979 TaxID=1176131 RepID=A0A6G1GJA2_9PEZI|nr:zf-DHHC-domain-containing protein [Aulographum hederae CBS 113979]
MATPRSSILPTSASMTDLASDDGDRPLSSLPHLAQPEPSEHRVPSVTGPVGEPGLPPSRPSSGASRGTRHSQGVARRAGGNLSSAGSVGGASSRPPSASRTHVPSLTQHAFFRPMSSQRLQAQRAHRPDSNLSRITHTSEVENGTGVSGVSYPIIRPGIATSFNQDRDNLPPPSRGTDITERDVPDMPDRTTANTSPEVAETVRSMGESVAPLQEPHRPTHLNLDNTLKHSSHNGSAPQKSPRSFRSSFIIPSRRRSTVEQFSGRGHEKLNSEDTSPRHDLEVETKEVVRQELGKNYQYFTGNTVFCWGGRLQNTRDRPINIATGLFILIPAALFLGFSAPWLWLNVSPAIPILFAYIFVICFSSFLHASITDPGILPRNLHPFPPPNPNEDPLALGPPTTEWVTVVSAHTPNSAMEVPTKYCKSCNIWRPPRAHHCRVCDNCIETQDHHCVWLNNCVGRRNYRYFFTFVASGTIIGIFLFAASLAHVLIYMNRENISFGASINRWRVPFAMVVYGFIALWYPLSLWGYHFFLMARGETTREYLNSHKFMKKDRHKPFTQGVFWKNWVAVLCRPRPPTYLRFKDVYEEGDQRFGPRRGKRTAPLSERQQGGVEMVQMG